MATQTLKEMDAEARRLTAESTAVLDDRDNRTPEDIDAAIKNIGLADSLISRIESLSTADASASAARARDRLAQFKRIAPRVGGDGNGIVPEGGRHEIKSIGELFLETGALKSFVPGAGQPGVSVELDGANFYKTALTSATGAFTNYDRQPGLIDVRQQRLTIADLMFNGTTAAPTIRYPREVSYTNAALAVAEGTAKPEAAWSLNEVDAPVRKIAVVGKISEEMLDDFSYVQNYLDTRMRFMVSQKEEAYLLNGSGTAPQITGILQTSGIQTQVCGTLSTTNTVADNVFRAITKIRTVGYLEPDAIVVHPTDYQIMRLYKDAQNQYYGGGPFTGAYGNSGLLNQPDLWGMKTVITTAMTPGTALVGAFQAGAAIFRRMAVRVDMTNSNVDDFVNNLISMRAEERLALCIYRPLAFCSVSGIA